MKVMRNDISGRSNNVGNATARRRLARAVLVLVALLTTGCAGRLVSPPSDFSFGKRRASVRVVGGVETSVSGPLVNLHNESRLRDALQRCDLAAMARKTLKKAIPASLKGRVTHKKARGKLQINLRVVSLSVQQPNAFVDWRIRLNVVGALVDTSTNKTIWEFELVQNDIGTKTHVLEGLSTDELVGAGGRRLRRELKSAMQNAFNAVLLDLQDALAG